MIVLGIDVPLVELAFASIIIIIVILLEMIIIALLTSKQLTFTTPFTTSSITPSTTPISRPPPLRQPAPLLPKISAKTPPKLPPVKGPLPTPISPPPVARPGKLKLDQELIRVHEQLSKLPLYTPQQAVIKTEIPSRGSSAALDNQQPKQQAPGINRLWQKIQKRSTTQPSPSPSSPEEARAYREVQQIARKVEAQRPAPKSELVRLDEELARLRKELQSTPAFTANLKLKKA